MRQEAGRGWPCAVTWSTLSPMARAYVEELPHEWGDRQVIITAWRAAGYRVEREVSLGSGKSRLVVSGKAERPGADGRAS